MVRGPNSGDGMRSSVYYLASSDLRPSDLGSLEPGSPDPGSSQYGSSDFGSSDQDPWDQGQWDQGQWDQGQWDQGPWDLRSSDRGPARPRPRALREVDPLFVDAPDAESVDSAPGPGGGWSGAGGRWLLWPLRAVLWAALLIVAFRGVTAIVFNQDSASPATTGTGSASTVGGQFPVSLAEAYAAEFGRVYLNFSPQSQGQREQQLAAFVPASVAAANPDLGWNGVGQMTLQSEQVAGIAVQDAHQAEVTLLASVNGQLIELGVPIAASGDAVVVSGEPAWLPAPAQIALPPAASGSSDPVAQSQLNNELPAFFQAYASGDSAALNGFLAPGVSLTGLGGTVAFDSIAGLHVPPGGTTRQITVSVIWQLAGQSMASGTKLQVTYGMSVVQQSSVKWYVKEISASIEAVGAQ
jgi:conjugative transposon protein TcpC